jgi:peptide-methionine (S)-S-oxide reductase
MTTSQAPIEQATFGGGCFWCTEAVFSRTKGVLQVESGYCNGQHPKPTYDDVCTGQTGHAEVVRISFDPSVVSFGQLLDVFFTVHDATTLNRQGNDIGTQYRSGVYTHSQAQADEALAHIRALKAQGAFGGKDIVTEVVPVTNYHPAEAYHQRYFENNPTAGYCAYVVAPKVAKFQKTFPALDTHKP